MRRALAPQTLVAITITVLIASTEVVHSQTGDAKCETGERQDLKVEVNTREDPQRDRCVWMTVTLFR